MHQLYLQQALTLAQSRKGFCAPNPAVGAVIVKDNTVLATGRHWASGFPHAEVEALAALGEEVRGATLYVTLEPCCHWGKTPPCVELLAQRGIVQVIYGARDPNPLVHGQGERWLQQAGITCQQLPLPEIDTFYRSYTFWQQSQQPWVTVKLALSLDGKIAGAAAQPMSITGEEARCFTHQQRKLADAILTTITTIENDDPALNVRLASGEIYAKPLYVLDSQLKLAATAKVFTTAAHITVFHARSASEQRRIHLTAHGVRCVAVDSTPKGLDLGQVVKCIGKDGIHDLWVEAGGKCVQALLQQQLVQRAFIYVAPKCLGKDAWPAFTAASDIFAAAINYQWHTLGHDAMCEMEWA